MIYFIPRKLNLSLCYWKLANPNCNDSDCLTPLNAL